MRNILISTGLGILIIFSSFSLFAQNNKPIIVNDTINMSIGDSITFAALQNDYDPDGDTFSPIVVHFMNESGYVFINGNNFEIKISNITWNEIDTIMYYLKDQYGKFSDVGYVFVNIAPNKVRDTLDINNISAPFASWGGDYFKNSSSGYGAKSYFTVPKDSNTSTIFASSLWLGAYDNSNILHASVREFINKPSDFMYGPISSQPGNVDAHDSTFNRVWKVSKYQIETHISNYSNLNYVMPEAIKNWPAHGDVSKGQAANLAPFVDVNGNGIYNPQQGDYPQIKGDECIFSIYNDNVVDPRYSNLPLKAEIHQMAYAYNCPDDTALNHTLFISYDVYNRSQNAYSNFFISNFYDFDLGSADDDYVGCDSSRNIFYTYNATNYDDILKGGYGNNPPAQGVKFLNYTMSSFNVSYYSLAGNTMPHDANNSLEFYNIMSGLLKDGSAVTNDGYGLTGNASTKYFYNGDVNDPNQWSELSAGNFPTDSKAVGSAGPFNFFPDMKYTLDIALIYSRGLGKTNLQNVDLLLQQSDHIQDIYDGVIVPCTFVGIDNPTKIPEIGFNIYPNPTNGELNISSNIEFHNAEYKIYSMIGQFVSNGILKNNTETIYVRNLQTGIYFLSITEGRRTYSQKFVVK